ncbi:WD40 repeat-like protein [Cucurbitaria berberidis CBS 394.84]|uniref:WD40 repeat-like protein n=1 Tax=Cucurbitaria berberidis CBS 394.84 TaxID=1168544 RepID=A0A9P4GUS3_9PLEO|nr:WD40 repeat-like protein [Cucurbitaria berberidis CBS 394.84]KAF1851909.1 WD40 repeat-like protein [Cucurbitaria berberidis CBS 394.84]
MAETLSSNVVNYIVWRYLQESGFGNAALQLSRCWIRDPETLPFAESTEPHTLIRLLQDGMCFDQLQAEACNTEPRYRFGDDHGRPYSVRNGALLTLDKGIPAHELATEAGGAVQEPPPKKGVKRKKAKPTNGVEPRPEPEVNGDAMEIEQNGATHVTNSVRAESEAMGSEAESATVAEIPISTLSIGHDAEIQTEVVADLTPATIFVPRPQDLGSVVNFTSWGPSESPVLIAAGVSLLQVHLVDKEAHKGAADVHLSVNSFAITALCWHSHGEMTVSAREQCFNEVGEKIMKDKLIKLIDGGENSQVISSQAGLVNTLRWNADKELLLSISTDGEKGSIKIWKNASDAIPAWTEFTNTAILDALWISESAFVVCGIRLFKIYEVNETLTTQRTLATQITWDAMRYDPSSGIIAAIGMDDLTSCLGILHPNDSTNLQTHIYPDQYLTDLDFRVRTTTTNALTNGSSVPPVLLATSSMAETVRIWDANEPFKCLKKLPTTDGAQAFKIAFSPDGQLLAAAGPDAVTVWDVERREVPVASWRAKDWASDKWDPSKDGEFSLGWDPDSSRLSIALGNQIAIIPIPR